MSAFSGKADMEMRRFALRAPCYVIAHGATGVALARNDFYGRVLARRGVAPIRALNVLSY